METSTNTKTQGAMALFDPGELEPNEIRFPAVYMTEYKKTQEVINLDENGNVFFLGIAPGPMIYKRRFFVRDEKLRKAIADEKIVKGCILSITARETITCKWDKSTNSYDTKIDYEVTSYFVRKRIGLSMNTARVPAKVATKPNPPKREVNEQKPTVVSQPANNTTNGNTVIAATHKTDEPTMDASSLIPQQTIFLDSSKVRKFFG